MHAQLLQLPTVPIKVNQHVTIIRNKSISGIVNNSITYYLDFVMKVMSCFVTLIVFIFKLKLNFVTIQGTCSQIKIINYYFKYNLKLKYLKGAPSLEIICCNRLIISVTIFQQDSLPRTDFGRLPCRRHILKAQNVYRTVCKDYSIDRCRGASRQEQVVRMEGNNLPMTSRYWLTTFLSGFNATRCRITHPQLDGSSLK